MKKTLLYCLAAMLLLGACAHNKQKLTPQSNLDLKSANVYYAQKDNEKSLQKALSLYNRVLTDNPDHVLALKRSADLYLYFATPIEPKKITKGELVEYQNMDKADSVLKSFKITYARYDAVIRVLSTFPVLNDNEKAIKRDAIKKKESSWVRSFKIGQLLYEKKEYQLAINTMEYLKQLQPDRQEPDRVMIAIYKDMGDTPNFEKTVTKALEKNPEDLDLLNMIAGLYYTNAGVYYDNANLHKRLAAQMTARAQADSANVETELYKTESDKAVAEYGKAIIYFRKIMDLKPLDINNMLLLSDCYTYQKDYPGALEILAKILKLEPDNVDALTSSKNLAAAINDTEKEVALWNRLIQLDPSAKVLGEYCFRFMYLLQNNSTVPGLGTFNDLMPIAEKWYQKDPTNKNAVITCVSVAVKIGRKDLEAKYTSIYRSL